MNIKQLALIPFTLLVMIATYVLFSLLTLGGIPPFQSDKPIRITDEYCQTWDRFIFVDPTFEPQCNSYVAKHPLKAFF